MYDRILIVVDEGDVARAAVEEGLAVARVHGAEVLFFSVLPNYVVPVSDMPLMINGGPDKFRKLVERQAGKVLAVAEAKAEQLGVTSTGLVGSGADPAECISRAANERACNLIVIGSHGRTALQRLMFGSTVTRLITQARVPVLVCKAQKVHAQQSAQVVPLQRRSRARKRKTAVMA